MTQKRITLFAGHYGSGKTEFSVNFALSLKEKNEKVILVDLDIVNPYFRTLDSEEVFREHGIKLICSKFANSNVDAPAMPKEVYELIDSRSEYGVLDIGGDDRGAQACQPHRGYAPEGHRLSRHGGRLLRPHPSARR